MLRHSTLSVGCVNRLVRLLGVVLIAIAPYGCGGSDLLALPGSVTQQSTRLNPEEHIQQLAQADVVYLGETHDSVADHEAQLQIIQALHVENPRLAIAFEMFQHPFQSVLDDYISGTIDEATLRQDTEYDIRWGFPWEFYAPMLRFAREQQLPVLALNASSEIVRKVARQGLDSLNDTERQLIPPLDEIRTDNENYREYVRAVFSHAHHSAHGQMDFENFFAAQVVWDETMADNIAQFVTENPDYQVVVIAGQGHVIYGYGIPDRVARRLRESRQQHRVLLNPMPQIVEAGEGDIADSFWFSP